MSCTHQPLNNYGRFYVVGLKTMGDITFSFLKNDVGYLVPPEKTMGRGGYVFPLKRMSPLKINKGIKMFQIYSEMFLKISSVWFFLVQLHVNWNIISVIAPENISENFGSTPYLMFPPSHVSFTSLLTSPPPHPFALFKNNPTDTNTIQLEANNCIFKRLFLWNKIVIVLLNVLFCNLSALYYRNF